MPNFGLPAGFESISDVYGFLAPAGFEEAKVSFQSGGPGGSHSTFKYKFPREVLRVEISLLKMRLGTKKLPYALEQKINDIVRQIELILFSAIQSATKSSISSGGKFYEVKGGGKGFNAYPTGSVAGSRIFRPSDEFTTAFKGEFNERATTVQSESVFRLRLGPGSVSKDATIPKAFRKPRSPSNSIPMPTPNPLQEAWQNMEPTGSTRIASSLEFGDRAHQRRLQSPFAGFSRSYSYGFHPFEGSIKKNYKALTHLYIKAVRDIFQSETILVYKGSTVSMDTFLSKVMEEQIMSIIGKDLKVDWKTKLQSRISELNGIEESRKAQGIKKGLTQKETAERELLSRELKFGQPAFTTKKEEDMLWAARQVLPDELARNISRPMLKKLESIRGTRGNNLFGLALDKEFAKKIAKHIDHHIPGYF